MTNSQRGAILPSNVDSYEQQMVGTQQHVDVHARMRQELRSWALSLVGLGVVNMVGIGDSAWGLLLIGVGISSLWFRSPSMFVVYTTTMTFAAVSNVASGISDGAVGWLGFGIVQLYLAFQTFRKFRVFSGAYHALVAAGAKDRAARLFPIGSAVLGLVGLIGMFESVVAVARHLRNASSPEPPGLLVGLAMDAAVLAVALALSSLLSRYRLLPLSLLGLLSGGLVVAFGLRIMFQ